MKRDGKAIERRQRIESAQQLARAAAMRVAEHGAERVNRCLRLAKATTVSLDDWLECSDADLTDAEARLLGP